MDPRPDQQPQKQPQAHVEGPVYSSSGLLSSNRLQRPVSRMRVPRGMSCKWAPSLRTVPQSILNAAHADEPLDVSLLGVLRIALLTDIVRDVLCGTASSIASGGEVTIFPFCGMSFSLEDILVWRQQTFARAADEDSDCVLHAWKRTMEVFPPDFDLVVVKEKAIVETIPGITREAVLLVGKDATLNDVITAHPSCSSQHAALATNFVFDEDVYERIVASTTEAVEKLQSKNSSNSGAPAQEQFSELLSGVWKAVDNECFSSVYGDDPADNANAQKMRSRFLACGLPYVGEDTLWRIEPQIIDLGSTNGTRLNGARVDPGVWTTLIEGDMITFGFSSRQYALSRKKPAVHF